MQRNNEDLEVEWDESEELLIEDELDEDGEDIDQEQVDME